MRGGRERIGQGKERAAQGRRSGVLGSNGLARVAMTKRTSHPFLTLAFTAGALLAVACTGCQSTVGGQTLPSPNYLDDDVEFFKAGPEDKIWRQRAALDKYRAEQEANAAGLGQP